ncbi:hypothetical protein BV25DRAFT_550686 [Artomyces pyxidatus]|uniref:Uncharacterized protein n=1 Tax=Artomyces pyxidatus TaxID=48021 RepID=A0ACB8TIL1_9AGAM|nr:hypothetical protein BV25DRAFT_550686 [Artomyces pyxidatus]
MSNASPFDPQRLHDDGLSQQQVIAMLQQQQSGRSQPPSTPSFPGSGASFDLPGSGADAAFFGNGNMDSSMAAKQIAALNAAGLARMAQTTRSSQAGGPTSGVGQLSLQSASAAAGHDPLAAFPSHSRPHFQAQSGLSAPLSAPPSAAAFNTPLDPLLQMQNTPARANQPTPQQLQNYKQKQRQFLHGLHTVHAARRTPLPPALTGFPYPAGYDPHQSKWAHIEPADVGALRIAGRDVDLFKLWSIVSSQGGGAKVSCACCFFRARIHAGASSSRQKTSGLPCCTTSICLKFTPLFNPAPLQPLPH